MGVENSGREPESTWHKLAWVTKQEMVGKSDGLGPADLHVTSDSTCTHAHTHTHTHKENLSPRPIFGWAFSVCSFCPPSILKPSRQGDEKQRNTLPTSHRPVRCGRPTDCWGDQKIVSGACASQKKSSTWGTFHKTDVSLSHWEASKDLTLVGSSSPFPTMKLQQSTIMPTSHSNSNSKKTKLCFSFFITFSITFLVYNWVQHHEHLQRVTCLSRVLGKRSSWR